MNFDNALVKAVAREIHDADARSCVCISYNRPLPYQTDQEVILDHAKYFPDTKRKTICVDACIAEQIEALWKAGIRTAGCCCGHNGRPWLDVGLLHPKDVERACSLLDEIDERLWHVWAYSKSG